MNIIPKPKFYKKNSDYFTINDKTSILFNHQEFIDLASLMKDKISETISNFGIIQLAKTSFTEEEINCFLLMKIDGAKLAKEWYSIEISQKNIVAKATSKAGIFYAFQTILQLLPTEIYKDKFSCTEIKIPCCSINDEPRFKYRGMHLDVSRHFFQKEFIYKYIDYIAMHKMNVFHWHLTDDNGWRIEIKKYPKLQEISAWRVDNETQPWRNRDSATENDKATYGGFYTQKEIKQIIEYAQLRNVTIIPEIEMPGHTLEVLSAYPELACFEGKFYVATGSYWPNKDIFCAGKEEVFLFIKDVLSEVIELFPSKFIHIGGDEVDKSNWKICPRCQKRIKDEGLKDEFELQSWFIKRIEKFLISKNKKMIGWDEILEGGLASKAVVMSWRGIEGGISAAQQEHDVIMTPGTHCYFDHYQSDAETEPQAIGGYTSLKKVYSFEPIPEILTAEQSKHIIGAQGNVWTEWIETPSHAEYMSIPRMCALAEVVWTSKNNRNWQDFQKRMQTHFIRLQNLGINYCKGSSKIEIIPEFSEKYGYRIILESEIFEAEIHYSIDEGKYINYKEPIKIDKICTVKASIFIKGNQYGNPTIQTIHFNKAIGKTVKLNVKPASSYKGSGKYNLTDGMKGSKKFRDGKWFGFEDINVEMILDMEEKTFSKTIEISFLQNIPNLIYLPENLIIEKSLDGLEWTKISSQNICNQQEKKSIKIFVFPIESFFRFIKIVAKNRKLVKKNRKTWIFVDQIMVL